jgi:hypothetical protein
MAANTEDNKIAEIRKHKEEYDSRFGPSGEVRLSENFSNVSISDKSNPDSLVYEEQKEKAAFSGSC